MKKIIFSIILTIFSFIIGTSQVQVGDGAVNYYSPIDLRYDDTYSQVIYLASELNATGTITSIKWYYNNVYETPTNQTMDVYIGNTTKSEFATIKDWEPVANLTKVFTGRLITNSSKGWKEIILTTPFLYDGTSNIVVAVNASNSMCMPFEDTNRFLNTVFSGSRSLVTQRNVNAYNPATPPTYSNKSGNVPNTIFVGLSQACETPKGLIVSNITTNSASVSWDVPINIPEKGTEYYVSASNILPDSNTIPTGVVTSGQTMNAIGLQSATYYYVWVRNNCGNGNYSAWSVGLKFLTLCAPVSSFYENCEGETAPVSTYLSLPVCWSSLIRGEKNLGQFPAAIGMGGASIHDQKCITMSNGDEDATKVDIILISPELTVLPLQNYRVKFWAKSFYAPTLQIGTIDNTNPQTAVFSQLNQTQIATSATEYTIDLTGYNGTDKFIAFRFSATDTNSNLSIDDIVLEPIPTCPDVSKIKVTATTVDSATVIWEDQYNSGKYQLAYGLESDSNPNLATQLTPTTAVTQIINGLNPSTNYKVWVRSICDGTRNGSWIGPISFTTPCNAVSTIHENFDMVTTPNLPNCWGKIIRGSSQVDYASIETAADNYTFSTPNCVKMYQASARGKDDDLILFTPLLESSTLTDGDHRLVFYARKQNDDAKTVSIQIGTLSSNTKSATFSVFQEVLLTNKMQKFVVPFDLYNGTDSYIGFRLSTEEIIGNIYIDNVDWETIPVCTEVDEVKASLIYPNNATISWTQTGSESSWEIAYSINPNDDPNNLEKLIANNDASIELIDLLSSTNYTVWVRAKCDTNDYSSWSAPMNFTTKCDPIESFNENFDSVTTPNLPNCWSKILRGETLPKSFAYVRTATSTNMPSQPITNIAVLYNNKAGINDDIILVSPNLSTLQDGHYRLRFYARGDIGVLQIGTLNSNDNSAVFTTFNTININYISKEYIIDFSSYSGSDTYIGFRMDNAYQANVYEIDNVIWEKTPLCPVISNLKTAYTTPNNAYLSWDANTSTKWEVRLGTQNDSNPDNLTPEFVTIPYAEFNNLTVNTTYKVWIRTVCGTNLNSDWSMQTFTTQCNATNVPYSEDFETAVTPNLPECTSAVNLSEGYKNWYVENNPINGMNGFTSKTLTYNSSAPNDSNSWFFTRAINLKAGENYTISYRYGGASTNLEYYSNNLKVMYGTQPAQSLMTNAIADYTNFAIDAPIAQAINFTPTTTDVYYFGFNVYSPPNSYYMFIDDIKIDVALSNTQFDMSKFSYYPNPVKDVLNISYINNITEVNVYNLLGQEVITKPLNNNLAKIDMKNLAKGTYMVKVTSNNLVKTIKVIKK